YNASASRQHKFLADFPQRYAFGGFTQRGFEALDGLAKRFKAEPKGLMMNGHNKSRASGIRHFNRLLGRAMRANPRVVSANRHNGEINRSVSSQFCETVGHCSVAGKNDPATSVRAALDQIPVVTAMRVAPGARAPVFDRERSDFDVAGRSFHTLAFAPIEFVDVTKPCSFQ